MNDNFEEKLEKNLVDVKVLGTKYIFFHAEHLIWKNNARDV